MSDLAKQNLWLQIYMDYIAFGENNYSRIIKLNAASLKNRPHMIFCS